MRREIVAGVVCHFAGWLVGWFLSVCVTLILTCISIYNLCNFILSVGVSCFIVYAREHVHNTTKNVVRSQ